MEYKFGILARAAFAATAVFSMLLSRRFRPVVRTQLDACEATFALQKESYLE